MERLWAIVVLVYLQSLIRVCEGDEGTITIDSANGKVDVVAHQDEGGTITIDGANGNVEDTPLRVCNSDSTCSVGMDCETAAQQYLSKTHFVDGFHVACLVIEEGTLHGEVFLDGNYQQRYTFDLTGEPSWKALRSNLEERLELEAVGSNPSTKYPWAMYSADGTKKLNTLEEALETQPVFIFSGGYFVWPGVEIGHVQTIHNIQSYGSLNLKTLSLQPLVFEISQFLTPVECDHIRTVSGPNLKPSPVSIMDHDKGTPDSYWRTSHNWFMPSHGEMMQNIDRRVADLTRVPKQHQEFVQVLRYELDQRLATVFWYLSDVEEGGETVFPRSGGLPTPLSYNDCTQGLRVRPSEGKAILFYSMKPDGQFDEYSLHGACPVIKGTKWAANKWVWTAPISFIP